MVLKEEVQEMVEDNHIQSAIISGVLFVLVAWPDLFNVVTNLINKIPMVGKNLATSRIIAVFLHAVIFAFLTYWVNKLLSKKLFSLL